MKSKTNIIYNNFYESLPEFDNHNTVMFINNSKVGLRGYIVFHRNGFAVPSFGATRFMEYDNDTDALRDALRLSSLMSYKNALAGLPYGGAKAVIIKPKNSTYDKNLILYEYAKHIERLNGSFITGTDMGLNLQDLRVMLKKSKNFVGLVNNPEKATALGMFYSLEPLVKHLYGRKDLRELSFAIQGLGKVGVEFLSLIYKHSSKIYVSDVNQSQVKKVKMRFPKVHVVDPKKIIAQPVDIFCPCAIPNILNSKTINQIKAKAILGSANNQLKSIELGETLHKLGILYCPDYVVNAGGLIAVADEFQFKKTSNSRLDEKLRNIAVRLDKILSLSKKTKQPPIFIAKEIARRIFDRK